MNEFKQPYFRLIFLHFVIGVLVYLFPFSAKIYAILVFGGGLLYILKTKNKNNEALFISAYIVGAEVFFRMTKGSFNYEFAKYTVILFLLIGLFYRGFSRAAFIYWIFLLLLIPGVFLSFFTLDMDTQIRKAIMFNISGSLCLGVSSIYCLNNKVSFEQIQSLLLSMGLPVVTTAVYLFLYTPNVKDIITGTSSNFETSGGFGPNQVSTILGLGIFVFFNQIVFGSKNKFYLILNVVITFIISYRALVTFSRGGVITALAMILGTILILFFKLDGKGKMKFNGLLILVGVLVLSVWSYSLIQTNGLLGNRYANQDAAGRVKKSQLTGREDLIESEYKMFLENPVFGIGVGKSKETRMEMTGKVAASHSEISRLLSEHGAFGILALLILLITPFINYIDNKHHFYMLAFFTFWILTINHAAMRTATPGFIYGLCLLKVYVDGKNFVRRE